MAAPRSRFAITGFGAPYTRGATWWIRYYWRGQEYRESTRSTRELDAGRLLKSRYRQIAQRRFVGPGEDRVLLTDLLDMLIVDYRNNRRRSLETLTFRLAPLRKAFALDRAVDVSEERVERYKASRLAEDAAPATVNRELAALKRAFRLGVEQKRISGAPTIKLLAEHNVREGFLEPADFEAVVSHLPKYLQDAARFAYISGWRKGEVASLEWSDVDRTNARITLRREHSKNGEPRVLPLTDTLAALIERRWDARQVKTVAGATLAPFVFHRAGQPIGDFRKAWAKACKAAGVFGTLFHDLRRSAVRNMERAGVSQAVAMKVTGHKTASVYRRYRIVDERDVREALVKTEAATRPGQAGQRTVVRLSPAKEATR
jgi:integrase